jgi:hypothetical protein
MEGKNIKLLQSYYGGSDDGLWLKFNINTSNSFGKMSLKIHNSSLRPISMIEDDLKISPGRTNYISVVRIFTEELGEPYSECLKDPINDFKRNKTLVKYLIDSGRSYTQKHCFELCFNLKYFEANPCNCTYHPWAQIFSKCYANANKSSKLYECSRKYRTMFSKELIKKECDQYCPVECNTIEYRLNTHIQNYPTIGSINDKGKNKIFII